MEKLPVEILVKIFKNLQQKDLLSLNVLCKKFYDVILDYGLIKRLYCGDNIDESFQLRHKFTEATIKNSKVNFKALEMIKNSLTTLEISQCTLKMIDILSILQVATNVKFLTFDYVRVDYDEDSIDENAVLPVLDDVELKFQESNPKIFGLLKKSQISKIKLEFYGDYSFSNFSEFVNFIKTQQKLTSLSVSGIYESNLFLIPMGKSSYNLKEFAIINCDFEEWDGLESYLIEHSKTLEKVTVEQISWDPSNVLNQCSKLKSLRGVQTEMNFLGNLTSVERLWMDPAIRTMDLFPNVKSLTIVRSTTEVNQVISTSMRHLEDLVVIYGVLAGLEVPSLKNLKFISSSEIIDGNFFITNNKIEKLDLQYIFNVDENLLETITSNLVNLKILRINGDNTMTARAFNIIKQNCKNLKTFEMSKWDQKFKNGKWKELYEINGLQVYRESFLN